MLSLEQIKIAGVIRRARVIFAVRKKAWQSAVCCLSHGNKQPRKSIWGVELFDRSSRRPTLNPRGRAFYYAVAKALLAQSMSLKTKSAEIHAAQRRKCAHHSRGRRVIAPNVSGGSQVFALLFHVQLDSCLWLPPYIIHAVADGNVVLVVILFQENFEVNKQVDFLLCRWRGFYCRMSIWNFL